MSGGFQRQLSRPLTNVGLPPTHVLQRCSCGLRSAGPTECTSCKETKRRLSRRAKADNLDFDEPLQTRVTDVLRLPGQPLDAETRTAMGSRFGRDFGGVRVHTDMAAAETAVQLNAEAYTVGRHIVFAPGRYAPADPSGRRLLAHELAHVVQQDGVTDAAAGSEVSIGPVDDVFEREAEHAADLVMAAESDGRAANVMPMLTSTSAPNLQRKACGPKVDDEVKTIWTTIGKDFEKLGTSDALSACDWLINPIKRNPDPDAAPRKINIPIKPIPFVRPLVTPSFTTSIGFNVNAFDTLPLFYGGAMSWLMNKTVQDSGCCIPSISEAEANWGNQKKCEDEGSCCSTVQIGEKCWLSGTVNYGTYGVMVRACHKRFPIIHAEIYYRAKYAAKAYKSWGHRGSLGGATTKEANLDEPMSWFEATYANGPGGTSDRAGNRPDCPLTCPLTGAIQPDWDYVWEPFKPRSGAKPAGRARVPGR
jgi:Domain of unknown function (DUF4157)